MWVDQQALLFCSLIVFTSLDSNRNGEPFRRIQLLFLLGYTVRLGISLRSALFLRERLFCTMRGTGNLRQGATEPSVKGLNNSQERD
jgi:hypothetical protein